MVELEQVIAERHGVLDTATALRHMTRAELRWRVETGRWQRLCRKVLVTHSGPLSDAQALWVALLWAGDGTVLGGLTAARLDGLTGFGDKSPIAEGPIHLVTPLGRRERGDRPPLSVVRHYSRLLGPEDIHPVRQPPRTRTARSLVDAASWMPTERGALAVLAAGIQQRLVRADDLDAAIARNPRLRRRKLISDALADIAGGAQALSEIDFSRRVVRRFRLPEPTRQMIRRDATGRRRYIDAAWDQWKVAVEIDGAQHMEPLQQWDDMDKSNQLQIGGFQVLHFPAWVVRSHPELVAQRIVAALRAAGWPG